MAQVCAALLFTSCLCVLLGATASVACMCSHHAPLWEAELGREFALHHQAVGVRLLGIFPLGRCSNLLKMKGTGPSVSLL